MEKRPLCTKGSRLNMIGRRRVQIVGPGPVDEGTRCELTFHYFDENNDHRPITYTRYLVCDTKPDRHYYVLLLYMYNCWLSLVNRETMLPLPPYGVELHSFLVA